MGGVEIGARKLRMQEREWRDFRRNWETPQSWNGTGDLMESTNEQLNYFGNLSDPGWKPRGEVIYVESENLEIWLWAYVCSGRVGKTDRITFLFSSSKLTTEGSNRLRRERGVLARGRVGEFCNGAPGHQVHSGSLSLWLRLGWSYLISVFFFLLVVNHIGSCPTSRSMTCSTRKLFSSCCSPSGWGLVHLQCLSISTFGLFWMERDTIAWATYYVVED
jgi:hypothetical protein